MVTISMLYEGDLHCQATHEPSGSMLATDAPKDNQGKGESFSPTDLVATALGTCMLTVMGIAARTLHVDISGARASVQKRMAAAPTRRIAELHVELHMPVGCNDSQKKALEKAAYSCPVHHSLHADIAVPITFVWAD